MKTINNSIYIKFISASLLLIASVASGFGYKYYTEIKKTEQILNNEKKVIIDELETSKENFEIAISENSYMKSELVIERRKIENLLQLINTTNVDAAMILNFKKEITRLNNVVVKLQKHNEQLIKTNKLYKTQRDSTILILGNSKKYNDTLIKMNKELQKTSKSVSKLSVINLEAHTYKHCKSGEEVLTERARKANLLKISFIIVGNKADQNLKKNYYVQIIDSKNNILGENSSVTFGNSILSYSYLSTVKFDTEILNVTNNLELKKPEKGTYKVNVFDKGKLVTETTFTLD